MKRPFKMADAEILDYWDAALDEAKALDALAVKNRTSREIMREKLRELGVLLDSGDSDRAEGNDRSAASGGRSEGISRQCPGGRDQQEHAPAGATVWEPRVSASQNLSARSALDGFQPVENKRRSRKLDEQKARALYDESKTDKEIGIACGVSDKAVFAWRKANGLPAKNKACKRRKEQSDVKDKRPIEDAVIEADEQRERAFEEILESVDAGKRSEIKDAAALIPEATANVPEAPEAQVTLEDAVEPLGLPEVATPRAPAHIRLDSPQLTFAAFVHEVGRLVPDSVQFKGRLVLNGRPVSGIRRVVMDSADNTLTVEIETC